MARIIYEGPFADYDEGEEYNPCKYAECVGFQDDEEGEGYRWTLEDSWDALTDGMYGDMPGNPLDYDAMMDAMGF